MIQERLRWLSSGSVGRRWPASLDGVLPVLPRRPAHPSLPQEVVGEAGASRELRRRRRRRGRRGRRGGAALPEGHLGAEQFLAGREGQAAQGVAALPGARRGAARAVGRLLGAPGLRGRPPRGGCPRRGRGWAARASGTGWRGAAVARAGRRRAAVTSAGG